MTEAQGVTISGGEPTCQPEALLYLLEYFNAHGVRDILLYTGRLICEIPAEILCLVSAVIDGRFVRGALTPANWKGSDNQTLTILREDFEDRYYDWQMESARKIQLISKKNEKFLIGIPKQEDYLRERLIKKLRGR